MSLKSTLKDILDVVAFQKDEDGNEISILAKAKVDLNKFLDEHTSISDDEKAKRIYDFFTNTITNVTVQAIAVAGQTPLQDAQIQTMKDETTQKVNSMRIDDTNKTNESVQKVISMQNEDKARLNDSAVNVAKAKAEIETLIPVQVQEITKKLELMDNDIIIKQAQVDLEKEKIPLMQAQTANETKKLDLMDKDIGIKEQQALVEAEKVSLMNAQTANETKKLGLTQQQIRVSATEVQYKLAQLKAIQKAGDINREIEAEKNATQVRVAEIYKA